MHVTSGHSMPLGLLTTFPVPTPASVTVKVTPGLELIVAVTGKLKEGFAGSLVEKVRLPLNMVPAVAAGGATKVTMRKYVPAPGDTDDTSVSGFTHSLVTKKLVGAATSVIARSSRPVLLMETCSEALVWPGKNVPNGCSKAELTTATGARCTVRIRLFPASPIYRFSLASIASPKFERRACVEGPPSPEKPPSRL